MLVFGSVSETSSVPDKRRLFFCSGSYSTLQFSVRKVVFSRGAMAVMEADVAKLEAAIKAATEAGMDHEAGIGRRKLAALQ